MYCIYVCKIHSSLVRCAQNSPRKQLQYSTPLLRSDTLDCSRHSLTHSCSLSKETCASSLTQLPNSPNSPNPQRSIDIYYISRPDIALHDNINGCTSLLISSITSALINKRPPTRQGREAVGQAYFLIQHTLCYIPQDMANKHMD